MAVYCQHAHDMWNMYKLNIYGWRTIKQTKLPYALKNYFTKYIQWIRWWDLFFPIFSLQKCLMSIAFIMEAY